VLWRQRVLLMNTTGPELATSRSPPVARGRGLCATSTTGGAAIRISVIIPCWNDDAALIQCLNSISRLDGISQIIIADASHEPVAGRIVREIANVRIVYCDQPNRGRQLNAGAALAAGDLLIFLHVDAPLTQKHVNALREAACRDGMVGGAFHREFDRKHRWRRWLVPIVRFYNCHFGALYGDQTLFVRRGHFARLGGFADIPLMEDVEFSRRLRKSGPITLLDPPVCASARRHERHGALRTTLMNLVMLILFRLHVSPRTLHRWYYRNNSANASSEVGDQ
jgi:hypothetical protein